MCLGLAGSLSSALGGLSELLTLNLTRNALSGTLPTSLGGLSKLQLLDLSACTRLQVCALIILLLPPMPKPAPLLPKSSPLSGALPSQHLLPLGGLCCTCLQVCALTLLSQAKFPLPKSFRLAELA